MQDTRAVEPVVAAHYSQGTRGDVLNAVLSAMAAEGKDVQALTYADLDGIDHFHGGGLPATQLLAKLAELQPGERVLDLGGGFGGPARTLAVEFGCRVTVLDLTEAFIQAGQALTERLGLQGLVRFQVGSSLDPPFPDGSFDVVWTQNASMNISDKARLAAQQFRLLRPGGRLAISEVAAGPGGPAYYPTPWARDPATSFLVLPDQLRAVLREAGFVERVWESGGGERAARTAPASAPPVPPVNSGASALVHGTDSDAMAAASRRNSAEHRVQQVRAVLLKPPA